MDRLAFLDYLKDSFTAYYDIIPLEECGCGDLPLAFRADYYVRGEKYWLSKSIPVWANEENEYCYVFSADSFDGETVSRCLDFAWDDGIPRVHPHKEHQKTDVKALFISGGFDAAALKELKSRNLQKTYHHSLWGYSNLIAAAVNLQTEEVTVNRAGRPLKQYFRKLFSAVNKPSAENSI